MQDKDTPPLKHVVGCFVQWWKTNGTDGHTTVQVTRKSVFLLLKQQHHLVKGGKEMWTGRHDKLL